MLITRKSAHHASIPEPSTHYDSIPLCLRRRLVYNVA